MHRCEIQHVDVIYSSTKHYNYVDMTYESMKTPVGGWNRGWSQFGPVEESNNKKTREQNFLRKDYRPYMTIHCSYKTSKLTRAIAFVSLTNHVDRCVVICFFICSL